MSGACLPGEAEPNPADLAIAEAAISLVQALDFAAAVALLSGHIAASAAARDAAQRHAYHAWYDLPRETRPPFWEWQHGRGR